MIGGLLAAVSPGDVTALVGALVLDLLAAGNVSQALGLLDGLLSDSLVAQAVTIVTSLLASGQVGQVVDLLGKSAAVRWVASCPFSGISSPPARCRRRTPC